MAGRSFRRPIVPPYYIEDCRILYIEVISPTFCSKLFTIAQNSASILEKFIVHLFFWAEKLKCRAYGLLSSYALSFYSSKMILDWPNHFGRVPIVLVRSKSFWSVPKHFGQGQIRLFWANFYNLDLIKMIWTRPKQIGPVQNYWYSTKMVWTVQSPFGPIEGQGIKGCAITSFQYDDGRCPQIHH